MEFSNLSWPEGIPDQVVLICSHCQGVISKHHKTQMLENSQWIPTAQRGGKTAGFPLNALYSPVSWFSWPDAVATYEQAKRIPVILTPSSTPIWRATVACTSRPATALMWMAWRSKRGWTSGPRRSIGVGSDRTLVRDGDHLFCR
ncbi:MAG: phage terminase large subunit family protein [Magnetococcales bacterium]|nr:phage terminase large subunit family protein [Magnetococcales bacterium]